MELEKTLCDALHGTALKKRILKETGISRKNWLVFTRHYGFADGEDWSYGRLARHYRVSEQCIAKKVHSVEEKVREWAQENARRAK